MIEEFIAILKQSPSDAVQELCVIWTDCTFTSEQAFERFYKDLHVILPALKTVKTDLTRCLSVTPEMLEHISKFFGNLSSVNSQHMICKDHLDSTISKIAFLPKLSRLTSLSLDFGWASEIQDEHLKEMAKTIVSQQFNLVFLSVNLKCFMDTADEGLHHCLKVFLGGLPNLKTLMLNLTSWKISYIDVNRIINYINQRQNVLDKIELNFTK